MKAALGCRCLSALLVLSCGCDPNIVLGARPLEVEDDASGGAGGGLADVNTADLNLIDVSSGDVGGADRIVVEGGRSDGSGTADATGISDAAREGDARATVLWFADHESADLSAWLMGGVAQGGGQYGAGGQTEVSRERAHGGSYSVKLTIDTTDRNDHTARIFRRAANGPAYYSAWFFWPQAHTPDVWWSIFLFRVHRDPNDLGTFANMWDVNVERQPNGAMTLLFYDHLTAQFTRPPTMKPLPVGQWTHIEVYFNYAPPNSTRITIWLDGETVMDLSGLGQAPAPYFYWSVGNGSDGLMPRVATIFIDDAAISTGRLGPGGGG